MIICISGPTAAGKSAAVLALSQHWDIEIINVDSATIYKGMDIGTAKPSLEERMRCPQHLLDICDPSESYSVANFLNDTHELIAAIQARGRIPILAGGTMMYFNALRRGLDELPQADMSLRQQLTAEAATHGWQYLHQRLASLDPITAERLAPNDSQRIQRALEVCLITGKPMSSLLGKAKPSPYQYLTISLEPSERIQLHRRIAQRFDQMLEQGFVQEVARLFERPDLHTDLPSIRCVGYRQIWSYLSNEISLEEAREQGIAATRQLAKRQITWLRSLPDRKVIDCLNPRLSDQVVDTVATLLKVA